MAKCDYCGTTILFGGRRQGDLRFCNDRCQKAGVLIAISRQLPESLVQQTIWETHRGVCPKCGGPGPIDVHTSYRVWSALLITSWKSRLHVSCRSCGVKAQLIDAGFSLALGWWGFPWGLVVTPIQIGRNLVGAASGPDPSQPSAKLEKAVRIRLASQAAIAAQAAQKSVSPVG